MLTSIKNGFLAISGGLLNNIWTGSFAYATNYVLNTIKDYLKDGAHYLEDYLWYYDCEEAGFLLDAFTDIVSGLLDIKVAKVVGNSSFITGVSNKIGQYFKPSLAENNFIIEPVLGPDVDNMSTAASINGSVQDAAPATSWWDSFTHGCSSLCTTILSPFKFVGGCIKEGLSWVSKHTGFNWLLNTIGFDDTPLSAPFFMIKLKGLISIGTGLYKIGAGIVSLFDDKPTYDSFTAKEIKKFIKAEEVTVMKIMNLNLEGGASEITLLKEACQTVMIDLNLLEEMMHNTHYHKIFTTLSKVAPLFAACQPIQDLKSHYSETFSDASFEKSMIFTDALSQILLYQPLINCFGYTKACENKMLQLQLDKQLIYYLKNATKEQISNTRGALIEQELHQHLDKLGVVLPEADFKLLSSLSLESEVLHNLFEFMNSFPV